LVVIEYIKSSIEILLSLKLEEQESDGKKQAEKSSLSNFFSGTSSAKGGDSPAEYEA